MPIAPVGTSQSFSSLNAAPDSTDVETAAPAAETEAPAQAPADGWGPAAGPASDPTDSQFQAPRASSVNLGGGGAATPVPTGSDALPTFKAGRGPPPMKADDAKPDAAKGGGAAAKNQATLTGSPGYKGLSPAVQQGFVRSLKERPADPAFTKQLTDLANNPDFRTLPDETKQQVLAGVKAFADDPKAVANFVSLATSPGFKQLNATTQKQFVDALVNNAGDKQLASSLTQLAGSPEFRALGDGHKALAIQAVGASGGKPDVTAAVCQLAGDPKFIALGDDTKTALLSQAVQFPEANAVKNLQRMTAKSWFTAQSVPDQQRSAKMVGYLSTYTGGDRKVLDNTLDHFLSPKGDYQVKWDSLTSDTGTTYGEASGKVLSLNKDLVPAGNGPMTINDDIKHLMLSTTPHEVNHIVNDVPFGKTFAYFQDEYRAWYVGFKAEHGRPPTAKEAMQERLDWEMDPTSVYGKSFIPALDKPEEAKQFYEFFSKMTGLKVDASNIKTITSADPSTWKTKPGDPAPEPVPPMNLDNH